MLKARDIVVAALMAAIMLISQVALAVLPNIELVSILIITGTIVFERKALLSIYIFALLEGLIYGFGIWWVNYLYVWTILYIIVRLLRSQRQPLFWAVISAIFGLSFGLLCAIPYAVVGGFYAGVANWVSGIIFDLLHCAGNFVVALVLFKPLYSVMQRVKNMT